MAPICIITARKSAVDHAEERAPVGAGHVEAQRQAISLGQRVVPVEGPAKGLSHAVFVAQALRDHPRL